MGVDVGGASVAPEGGGRGSAPSVRARRGGRGLAAAPAQFGWGGRIGSVSLARPPPVATSGRR